MPRVIMTITMDLTPEDVEDFRRDMAHLNADPDTPIADLIRMSYEQDLDDEARSRTTLEVREE